MNEILAHIPHLSAFNTAVACIAVWAFITLGMPRRRVRTTRLRGPPSSSFIYGVGKILLEADDSASIYEAWAREYGAVYEAPLTLGGRRIVLYDPKAITHFYSKETWTYVRTPMEKHVIEQVVSRVLIGALCLLLNLYHHSLEEVCFGPKEKATEGMSLNLS